MTLLLAPLFAAPLFATMPAQEGSAQTDTPKDVESAIPSCDGKDEVVLPSGIKYCVLVRGADDAPSPERGDKVSMHYTGWLLDGTEFDSSRKPRRPGMAIEPFEFAVGGQVIDGWSEIAEQMRVGDRLRVTLPPEKAYGEKGSGAAIPPNATLVFDMEMLDIPLRKLEFAPWPETPGDDVIELASGVKLRVLAPGEGKSAEEVDLATVRLTCFNPAGRFIFGDTMGRMAPLSFTKTPLRGGLPFFEALRPYVKKGARLQCNVPAKAGLGAQNNQIPGLPEGSAEIWMFECTDTMTFEKPEFQMPADDVLTTTASGLKYVITREGTGRQPTAANTVNAHYAGWLTTGSPFDNSYDRGAPSQFALSRVVRGWTEGLQFLKEGGAGWFVIPPELGYGNRAKGGIPANSTLVFYVELIGVQ